MNLEAVQDQIKDYAKDVRLNIGNVLGLDPLSGLTERQNHFIALAAAYSTRSARLVENMLALTSSTLSDSDREAAKSAASIMAMNNVYYRSLHMLNDPEMEKKPARLRMTVIGKPGVEKVDFELACLGVSAIAGCKGCIASHAAEVKKQGVSVDGVQTAIRIAAVINSVATALFID